ncbi:hypothetical protein [Lutibacter maritimus]|uniref:Uncharacterized protein n=1 Tax=Lutibacter maritimus TaxID=593133 RepID=A0A1I6NSA5_9FLAO|nr:hypothetical protein [Lutibacter maritimus]SFS30896.1 hypothetical protein SAMN04488006_0502 [Lutibacter maritimus]
MLQLLSIQNLKTYALIIAIICVVWFYKSWEFRGVEMQRQAENMEQIRKYDSLKFASQTYTKKELDQYLEYNRKDLQQFLKENKIATRKIEQIITQSLKYRDTTIKNVNLQPILDAIKQKQNIKVPVIDSTACMIIKGYVVFENDTLSLNITDRQFKNTSDVIKYWERNQWKFLGIKTRLFGRKQATVIIKDACGNTQTFVIDKNKKPTSLLEVGKLL